MTRRQIIIFTLLYFCGRLVFYPLTLRGEEGIFANIFLYHPSGPYYSQMGRLAGEEIYTKIDHPALIYEIIRQWGMAWQFLFDYAQWSELATTVLVRMCFSVFEYVVWIFIFLSWNKVFNHDQENNAQRNRYFIYLLFCLAVWPASLLNTTNINIDASVGVLLVGLLTSAIMLFANKKSQSFSILLIAAFFSGFGKNEISVVLLLSLLCCGLVLLFAGMINKNRVVLLEYLPAMVVILIANLLGNLLNYWIDPLNYLAGFKVFQARGTQASLFGTGDFTAWSKIFLERLSFIFIHLVLWSMSAWKILQQWRNVQFPALLTFVYGSALFFGYFFSYAEVGSRYFEPSLIVLTAAFLMLFAQHEFSHVAQKWLWGLLVVCSLHSTAEISSTTIRIVRHPDLIQSRYELPIEVLNTGCVPVLEQAMVFRRPDIDYVAYESMKSLVESRNKKLCTQALINR